MISKITTFLKTALASVRTLFQIVIAGLALLLLIQWALSVLAENKWQDPFEAELIARGYDSAIVHLERFEVLERVNIVQSTDEDAQAPSRKVTITSKDSIKPMLDGSRSLAIHDALPNLFIDAEDFTSKVICVQAKARRQLPDGGFSRYEDVFWVTYENVLIRRVKGSPLAQFTRVKSNSPIQLGDCITSLAGWIVSDSD